MRRLVLAICLLLLSLLSGCGYSFSGTAASGSAEVASRLDPALRKMVLVRVENPSVESWLEPRLRSLIRDEFNRRRLVEWTEKTQATSQLTVIIKRYSRSTLVAGQKDQSLKLSAAVTMRMRVTRASDGRVLWDSGEQSQSESFYPGDADGADMRLTDLIVRRLADLMTEQY